MEIYLIRHTEPEIEKGICYGQTDVPLKDTFKSEAEIVLQNFPDKIEVVYSSPLSRCLQLAEYVSSQLALPLVVDNRLKELNFGQWEMKKWVEIDSDSLQRWMDDYVNVQCIGGESYQELTTRVSSFLDDLRLQKMEQVAIVTHQGVMKAIHAKQQQLSLRKAMEIQFHYGSIAPYFF